MDASFLYALTCARCGGTKHQCFFVFPLIIDQFGGARPGADETVRKPNMHFAFVAGMQSVHVVKWSLPAGSKTRTSSPDQSQPQTMYSQR